MLCGQCRRAEAAVELSYTSACATRRKPLCEPCARSLDFAVPFTLTPLKPPDATVRRQAGA